MLRFINLAVVFRSADRHLEKTNGEAPLPSYSSKDDRSDPNVSQNAPVIPRFNALSALRSKMAQQTRESGDEALAAVYGTVNSTYILLDALMCSIAEYFYELCCKRTTTSKNTQRYYTSKRLISDLLSNCFH